MEQPGYSHAHANTRIRLDEPVELEEWMHELGVTADALRNAVHEVGDNAETVREYLARHAGVDG